MKKLIALLLAAVMVLGLFAACGNTTTEPEGTQGAGGETKASVFDYDTIRDEQESADGKYPVAFVTDVGQLKDKSFNQGTWEGVKRYASENNKGYKYYSPANSSEATDDDRFNAMKAAVDNGAEIVVCAGFLQESALRKAAETYPDVKFVFIDGYPVVDSNNETLTNVAPISFQEEQSGYLAGYATVMEGYTKLGFSGGGGGSNPACCRFGYGYVQGASAAAAKLGVDVELKYSWEYGSSFSASPELQTMLDGWYSTGTQVVFACGGSMCNSAFEAANKNDGYVIGVDVDQSSQSDTIITSATKGLREAAMYACEAFYLGEWDAIGGTGKVLGAADDAVGLPTATWSLETFTQEQYEELLGQLKAGTVTVDADYETGINGTFDHVTLSII